MSAAAKERTFRRTLALARPFRARLALAGLLGFLTVGTSIGLMATSAWLISKAALRPDVAALSLAIVAVRGFGISRGVFRYAERLVSHDLTFRLLADLRVRVYEGIEPLAPAGLAGSSSGDLLSRMVADVESLQHLFVRVLAPPVVAALTLALAAGIAATLAPAAAVAIAAAMLVAGVAVPWLARRAARGDAAGAAATGAALTQAVVDALQGAAELAAFGREADAAQRIGELDRRATRLARRAALRDGATEALETLLAGLAFWAALVLAVPAVRSGRLPGVALAVVVMIALAAFEAVLPLPQAFRHLESSLAAARRLFAVIDAPPPVSDPPHPRRARPGVLALQGARLRYGPGEPWALDGVDLRLAPGARVALVGPSGAGKTTVANALLRFRELDAGRATLDGVDLRDLAQADVRRVVGLAAEDAHLFNTSVRENLRLARPGASDDELADVARRARVLGWVESLPAGWDTIVGERGALVSGGQRQRLALARALLADFPILVLDEPTANLDPPTARRLMSDLLAASKGRSVLVITHRLAGLEGVDEVVVLDGGRVVERGTHGDLLARRGRYRRMWEAEGAD